MRRREFIQKSLLATAGLAATNRLTGPSWLTQAQAQSLQTPYPVLMIFVAGGIDDAMHFLGHPAGSVGQVELVHRPTTGFKTAAGSGISYYTETLAPAGATDFEPFLSEMSLLKGVRMIGDAHAPDVGALWFGADYNARRPWGNYLASALRQASPVQKPCAIAYVDYEAPASLIEWGNGSPDPIAAAERILSINGFFGSLSSAGLPEPKLQSPAYQLVAGLDGATYPAASQPRFIGQMSQAQASADLLLSSSSAPPWPPTPEVMSALGVSNNDLTAGYGNLPAYKGLIALAYQALKANLVHVLMLEVTDFDSHSDNISYQINAGRKTFPALGRLLKLMKSTPSPIEAGKSLFDTTNIWIQSEMGRSPGVETFGTHVNGTAHWASATSAFLGGRFKKATVIGDRDGYWNAVPIDPVTGRSGSGKVMGIDNVIATVIKACGASPGIWTTAQPIDALLI